MLPWTVQQTAFRVAAPLHPIPRDASSPSALEWYDLEQALWRVLDSVMMVGSRSLAARPRIRRHHAVSRMDTSTPSHAGETPNRIAAVEHDIDAGDYRPGAWQALLKEVRRLPRTERVALANDITRVSHKRHARANRQTIPFTAGLLAEVGLAITGLALLWLAIREPSNVLAIGAAALWITAFQPLVKIGAGGVLGMGYEYVYFLGVEPRFKLRYGDYLAAPRGARILFHLSGMIGSPLGAWLPTLYLGAHLRAAIDFCWAAFGLVVASNLVPFVAALAGVQRIGPLKLSRVGAASAASEIRECFGY